MSKTDLIDESECEFSGLPKFACSHCTGDELGDEPDTHEIEYEVKGRPFDARFPGRCTIDYDHQIRKGDLVAYVQRADNPMMPVQGVACQACVKSLPRA